MVSGVATYCMIIGLCIGLIIIAFIIHRTVKNKREKRAKQEQSLEQNNERQGDDPPIQQPHTSIQVDKPPEYAPDNNGLSPPPKYMANSL